MGDGWPDDSVMWIQNEEIILLMFMNYYVIAEEGSAMPFVIRMTKRNNISKAGGEALVLVKSSTGTNTKYRALRSRLCL